MKLYTEEQVNMIAIQVKEFGYYDNSIISIELPSDEEIEEAIDNPKNDAYSFRDGAKWVIDKIKNQ